MGRQITAIVVGVIALVIGLSLGSVVVSTAATNPTGIGSFAGAQNIKDILPLIFYAALVVLGVGLMLAGGAGFLGRGPLS